MPREMRAETDWILLPGKTLEEIETIAIKASFARNNRSRGKTMRELQIAKTTLLRKLDRLGLRNKPRGRWVLTEAVLEQVFSRHCAKIVAELNINRSTLIRWINKRAPFAVDE
ncbi:MAG TPA: hypothetical protein VGH20_19145 [Myxococcales bacterium]|jgi:transcriptional regulator with PAS, ATPase and Fis domain